MAIDFRQAFYTLEQMGIADIILPFLLIFTIVFAIFQKTEILGDKAKKFNIVIAVVMASAAIFPHITGNGPDVIPIINNSLPSVGTVAIAIIMILFLLGVLGLPAGLQENGFGGFIGFLAMGVVIYIFGASAGWFTQYGYLSFLFDSDTQALLLIVLIFGVIIWFITGKSEEEQYKDLKPEQIAELKKHSVWNMFNDSFKPRK